MTMNVAPFFLQSRTLLEYRRSQAQLLTANRFVLLNVGVAANHELFAEEKPDEKLLSIGLDVAAKSITLLAFGVILDDGNVLFVINEKEESLFEGWLRHVRRRYEAILRIRFRDQDLKMDVLVPKLR